MNKTIITFINVLFLHSILYSQVGFIPVEDEIYSFMNRMNTLGIIENYNSFELPKSRNEIKRHLETILNRIDLLDKIDRNKLADLLSEYEYDLVSTNYKSSDLFPSLDFNYLLSEKEKYLYSYYDNKGNSIFVNFIGKLDYLHSSDLSKSSKSNSLLYRFGGNIRGTIFDRIGFEIQTTNGSFTGNKKLAQNYSSLKYNYKFHRENDDNTGDNYFDETSSFLAFQNSYATIKIGNDRKNIGHGFNKILISNNAPRMEYVSLETGYKSLSFSFIHGKLLGTQRVISDNIHGSLNVVSDKYLAYHRLGIDFSKHLQLGLGEMIIYADRNLDFAYLNPFNFYKSAEHANQDRDNSFLFFDFKNNSFPGLKLYSTILIDDIDFGKLGTGWYGNQTLLSIGAYSTQLYGLYPIDIEVQYLKIDPYVYTHRIEDNNFTNLGYNIGSQLEPNSSSTNISIHYRPHHRVNITSTFSYTLHGANVIDENGAVISNVGGDISTGHRVGDFETVFFLQGDREIYRDYTFRTVVEPIKNWQLGFTINYSINSLARSQRTEELFTTFTLYTKL